MGKKELNRSLVYRLVFIFFIVLVVVVIISFISYANKGNSINITSEFIEITGIRGERIDFNDIVSIDTEDSIERVEARLMGSEVGSNKRGTFKLEQLGMCRLHVNTDIKSYIKIRTNKDYIIINYLDENTTMKIFEELKSKWQSFKK